jgi:antitoxin component YwqK of YwqJK toxin-antitoxin module
MKFLSLSILLLFLTACDVPSSLEQSAKAVVERTEDVFALNNKEVIDEAVMMDKLQVRGELTYIPNTEEPYSGFAKWLFDDGQLQFLVKFKNGYISAVKSWRTNGSAQKYFECEELEYDVDDFKTWKWEEDGSPFSNEDTKTFRKLVFWHENEQVELVSWFTSEGQFDGKIGYFKNGQKSLQTEMKEGLVWNVKTWKANGESAEESVVDGDGEVIRYSENGDIDFKGTYKNGKINGEEFNYYIDGDIYLKTLFKDGELIESPLK